ncbi:helix-turn-helix domain-containing protein [Microbacterium oxydans]|uniref:AraC family transcriptional regulator n=1 Tax=Microbacterium oxydans TaxID=82380 RepID=UPI0011422C06|nr:GyrI-like domain-containing protein [Microbacterium oxydans]KAB1889959.1 helix-turn-helix domain-containing protein [Microbacterium oxydans]GED40361.1 AraC family transcriptional regulator [Microbacterium oxydans]
MKAAQYQQQLDDVTEYIYRHLDDDLDLSILAEVARFSPYHWHRIYRAVRGETAAQTVLRLRLERAASLLVETGLPITRIARRAGFSTVETFSRALSRGYGMPPARFREAGAHAAFQRPGGELLESHPVEIRETGPVVLAVSPHRGPYLEIGRAFARVRDRFPQGGRMVAVYEDDPDAVPARSLRSAAGVVIADAADAPESLEVRTIPAGRHAVLEYSGPYSSMHRAYRWLYGRWLPASGEVPRDHPVFEEYLSDPATTAPTDSVTEIWLPLA